MKIEFTERDKEVAEMIKNKDNHLRLHIIALDQEKVSVEFKINDPYKAQIFLEALHYSLKDYMRKECGLESVAISSIGVYSDLYNLSDDLHKAIDDSLHKNNL